MNEQETEARVTPEEFRQEIQKKRLDAIVSDQDNLKMRVNLLEAHPIVQVSPDKSDLYKALAIAQGQIQAAEAKSEADMGTYQYRYADLAACLDVIRDPLSENGLCLIQIPSIRANDSIEVHLTTILGHESGQSISCEMSMYPDKSGPQAIGATITYLRCYSLSAMIGVAQFDDDAASATKGPEEYERLSPRDIDEILIKADELFGEKADYAIKQMVERVFNLKHLADIPADQLKVCLQRLQNTYKREQKKAKDAEKSPVEPKEKVTKSQPKDREPGEDDE